jgi:hypothetical protein
MWKSFSFDIESYFYELLDAWIGLLKNWGRTGGSYLNFMMGLF